MPLALILPGALVYIGWSLVATLKSFLLRVSSLDHVLPMESNSSRKGHFMQAVGGDVLPKLMCHRQDHRRAYASHIFLGQRKSS